MWSLISFILTILTILSTLIMKVFLILYRIHDENLNQKNLYDNHARLRLLHCIVTIAMALVFVYLNDISLKMVIIDKYTPLMMIIFAIQLLLMTYCTRTKK